MNRARLFISTAKAATATAFSGSFLSGKAKAQPASATPPASSERVIYGRLGSPDATSPMPATFCHLDPPRSEG
jgi:hypothetical protein